jgi:hypothetical protein
MRCVGAGRGREGVAAAGLSLGEQPLLIVGVAEPIVLIYSSMYEVVGAGGGGEGDAAADVGCQLQKSRANAPPTLDLPC